VKGGGRMGVCGGTGSSLGRFHCLSLVPWYISFVRAIRVLDLADFGRSSFDGVDYNKEPKN
jgi:hypothetical protein